MQRLKSLKRLLLVIFIVYLLPTFASAGWWAIQDRPGRWSDARWTSANILPSASDVEDAAIYIFSATTGGIKGAVASHAWIVTKKNGASSYTRYDKVGWGTPIRLNHRPADAYWYSNRPQIVKTITGDEAALLIPRIEHAIARYPHAKPGDYRLFPGPNSNSFIAHILRTVPQIGAVLPPHAVGRDFLPDGAIIHLDEDWRNIHVTLGGLAGISVGMRSGLEVHLFGLVAGLDFFKPGIKVPAIGRIGL